MMLLRIIIGSNTPKPFSMSALLTDIGTVLVSTALPMSEAPTMPNMFALERKHINVSCANVFSDPKKDLRTTRKQDSTVLVKTVGNTVSLAGRVGTTIKPTKYVAGSNRSRMNPLNAFPVHSVVRPIAPTGNTYAVI
jgi:hypothetical protein